MTKNEKKLRLRENEVVHCMTYDLACKCCELADSLGFTWWSRSRYLDHARWADKGKNILYDFHGGSASHLDDLNAGKVRISAEEWLNRHGIFVFGQLVHVRNDGDADIYSRYYVIPNFATTEDISELHESPHHLRFDLLRWDIMESTYRKWVAEEDHIITIDGKEVILSKESYEALKKAVEKN